MEADDVIESTFRLQKSLQTFIYHVEDLLNEDDPSGDGFTREFRVRGHLKVLFYHNCIFTFLLFLFLANNFTDSLNVFYIT